MNEEHCIKEVQVVNGEHINEDQVVNEEHINEDQAHEVDMHQDIVQRVERRVNGLPVVELMCDDGVSRKFASPPEWVQSNNVYTNMYRRAQAVGNDKETVKSKAREARLKFKEHGLVPLDLVYSFGMFKRGKRGEPDAPVLESANPAQGWYVNQHPVLMGELPQGA